VCEASWPLSATARDCAGETALVSHTLTYSFREYAGRIDKVARALAASGLKPGDRAAIVARPSTDLVLLILACCRSGVVACPINPRWPVRAVHNALKTVQHKVIITDAPHASFANLSGSTLTVHELVNTAQEAPGNVVPISPDQPVTGVFTSGTTGEPKLALLTLQNHIANAVASNRNISVVPGDRWLLSLPLHHVAGLAVLFRCMVGRAAVVVPQQAKKIPEAIERYGITHLSLVPTQLYRLLQDTENIETLRRLKAVLVGGGPANPALIRDGFKHGLRLFTTYGLTETASQVTTTEPDSQLDALLSSGRPLIPSSVAVTDDGEILVRGKTLFTGYATQDEIELPLTEAGWFPTGDLGHFDQHSNLHVTGRKDNRFVCGGENVQPEEIERHVCGLEGVAQCVVVPIEDDEFGFVPVAFVRRNDDKPFDAPAAVVDTLKELLPRHMIPTAFFPWPQEAGEENLKPDRRRLKETAKRLYAGLSEG